MLGSRGSCPCGADSRFGGSCYCSSLLRFELGTVPADRNSKLGICVNVMFGLDVRLQAVFDQVRCPTHVDVGSDHARLLAALLKSGRIERGIAIENKQQPFVNSRRRLANLAADVRFGDGLAVLEAGEAESLSICGMGAESIVQILEAFPDRVPPRVFLQPNRQPELVRRWGLRGGFHLVDERIACGHWPYSILTFQCAADRDDPAYDGIDRDAALLFGPLNLRRRSAVLERVLREELEYLQRFDRMEPAGIRRRETIEAVLATWSETPATQT